MHSGLYVRDTAYILITAFNPFLGAAMARRYDCYDSMNLMLYVVALKVVQL